MCVVFFFFIFFFFKQKTAYEMRISDWSSDVCSSDLFHQFLRDEAAQQRRADHRWRHRIATNALLAECGRDIFRQHVDPGLRHAIGRLPVERADAIHRRGVDDASATGFEHLDHAVSARSEAHTSELQSLMRISYAVFCLKKKNQY